MGAGSVLTRGSRSVPRAGAVVVVLLATLLHVLGCSHGPTATDTLRIAALAQAAPVSCGQQPGDRHRETTAGQSTPAHDEGAHCCALDEPTVQPPRHPGPAGPPLPDVLPSEPPGPAPAVPPSAHHHSPTTPAAFSAGHAQSLLGVWRT
ncbi:hypothetical protein [Streptomyces sp. NPDC052107]|uniref:hypothetical protein n=1 Tax=Streptomyces sp. NPDC052107 TaxID=3155632 RepID=UPI00341B0E34